jgi:hypothetical protein
MDYTYIKHYAEKNANFVGTGRESKAMIRACLNSPGIFGNSVFVRIGNNHFVELRRNVEVEQSKGISSIHIFRNTGN